MNNSPKQTRRASLPARPALRKLLVGRKILRRSKSILHFVLIADDASATLAQKSGRARITRWSRTSPGGPGKVFRRESHRLCQVRPGPIHLRRTEGHHPATRIGRSQPDRLQLLNGRKLRQIIFRGSQLRGELVRSRRVRSMKIRRCEQTFDAGDFGFGMDLAFPSLPVRAFL
jgi:hypothetical protein